MPLDLLTMSTVNITVTSVLGIVLLLTWARERSALIFWWGTSLLIMALGVLVATASTRLGHAQLAFIGPTLVVFGAALQWHAVRQFARRPTSLAVIAVGPVVFLLAGVSGILPFDLRLVLTCTLLATYSFAAAAELALATQERLGSRAAAMVLLVLSGAGYLCWLPLIAIMPIREASHALTSKWFALVILITLAGRVALAFMVLGLAKERREHERRVDALTDPLTGLPNRRALAEAAHELSRSGMLSDENPISVLLFDLDHFKEINDAHGHRLGDHVLRVFATTLAQQLDGESIVARMGGEEFAAILPGANRTDAEQIAERVRSAFESSAALVDGVAVRGTVSIGACSEEESTGDLGSLFHRADRALYRAKNAGRNRVVLIDGEGAEAADVEEASRRLRERRGAGRGYVERLTA